MVGKTCFGRTSEQCKKYLVATLSASTQTRSNSRQSTMCLSKGDQGGFDEHDDLDDNFQCRMEEEEFKEVYIVKLPNNFCGIGACVIDHPKKVKK